jgi:predicted ArsR family transcriptional regulator
MLLDSLLLVSASLPRQGLSPAPSFQSSAATPLSLLATPAGAWSFADGRSLSANMTTRGEIMAYIVTNPGVYLREIGEDLGLSMGTVQYHTWVLTKNGDVEDCRSGRYRRFFGARRYGEEERVVISLLRQGTTGRILTALSGSEPLTHTQLAGIVGISSQALSWQIRRLRETGIVEALVIRGRQGKGYRLLDNIASTVRSLTHQRTRAEARLTPIPAVT